MAHIPHPNPVYPNPLEKKHSKAMHTKILIGLLIGAAGGIAGSLLFGAENAELNWFIKNITQPLGGLWLRLLLMIVVPLVFSALVLGVAGLGNIKKLGRIGIKTLAYTLVLSAISVVVGLGMVNLIEPGKRISAETAAELEAEYGSLAGEKVGVATVNAKKMEEESVPVITAIVEKIIPENPLSAMVGTPNLLHIMFFALVLGMAATLIPKETAVPFLGFFDGLFEISIVIINAIMQLAPYAVALLVFSSLGSFGMELLTALLWFILVVLGGLLIHGLFVYSTSVYLLSALPPIKFYKSLKTTIITAFSTSSSNATLPTALRESKENLGVPEEINSFVLTIGATANQNGTALYEGITIIFLAQLAGIELSLAAQLGVAYLAILGGIGTAGVPGGSIPYIIVVLVGLGVNPSIIAIILGVDRVLDMCRTTVNVIGDITAATFVARSEGYHLEGELRPPPEPNI
jgi:DAACS family dicarboxylate/amino acid:cation (Na+ or H+) symporter